MKKRMISAVMVAVLTVSIVPAIGYANEENEPAQETKAAQETQADKATANSEEQTDNAHEDNAVEQQKENDNTQATSVEIATPVKEKTTKITSKKKAKVVKIMLDAGHAGRYNRGKVRGYWESHMTWKLTRYLKKELESYGFKVGMTKKSLYHDPSVYSRGRKAKGYDLFLSIHSNWAGANYVDYPLTIVSSKYKKKLYKQAQPIGKKLVKQVRKTMRTRQRGQVWTKRQSNGKDWYGVIRGAASVNVPAVIIEHSFHSNRSKCKWLMKNKNLKKMAKAEAKVLAKHYGMKKK